MSSSHQQNEPNSTGLIIHDQAAESVDELRTALDSLASAVPAAVPANSSFGKNNKNSADQESSSQQQQHDDQQESSSVQVLKNTNSFNASTNNSQSVNEKILSYEQRRHEVIAKRQKVVHELRSKLIQPLASNYYNRNAIRDNNNLQQEPSTLGFQPLMKVHQMTMDLLKADNDLMDELEAQNPKTMDDLANSTAGNRSQFRGTNNLSSLIPVAWCIRVSYVEAARMEINSGKKRSAGVNNNNSNTNGNQSVSRQSTTTTTTNYNDDSSQNKSEVEVAASVAGERQQDSREETVDEQLSNYVSNWKEILETGKIPVSVLNFIRQQLSS